jgi:hypothetical protein
MLHEDLQADVVRKDGLTARGAVSTRHVRG